MSFIMTQDLIDNISQLPMYKPKESNRIALRVCKYCGKTAYNEDDLQQFVSAKMYKFGRRNTCKDCYALMATPPVLSTVPFHIVGPYCKLDRKKRRCVSCGLPMTPGNTALFNKRHAGSHGTAAGSTSDKCEVCQLKAQSEKKGTSKPSSLAARSFLTSTELNDIATLRTIEINLEPEGFLSALRKSLLFRPNSHTYSDS